MTEHQAISLVRDITALRLRAGALGCRDVAKALDTAAYLAGKNLGDKIAAERQAAR